MTWFHVELDRHDVILAEGLATESYPDTGNRAAFDNAGPLVQAYPRFAPPEAARAVWNERACAPLVLDAPLLTQTRAALLNRAALLGWQRTRDPALSVLVDGVPVRPGQDGYGFAADLPPGSRVARHRSRRAVPAHLRADDPDHRILGVAVAALHLDGVAMTAARRGVGWNAPESGWQWTDGDAAIDVTGARRITFRLLPLLEYWVERESTARTEARRG